MEDFIQISKINDFIFCPYSLYYHSIYEGFSEKTYHGSPQVKGKIKHERIDEGQYSTAKKFLQGWEVFSEKYGLKGKIDIYDAENKILIERKNKVVKIYDGYKYQLYAQSFCLQEMGYKTDKMFVHSMIDNKKYEVELPSAREIKKFENIINEMRNFSPENYKLKKNTEKCANCIYCHLCCA